MVRALLGCHASPVPFHAVRTRFLENIATPIFNTRGLRDVTRIMDGEMHEAVLSCARARRQIIEGIPTMKATVH